jgi:hypothetical protein
VALSEIDLAGFLQYRGAFSGPFCSLEKTICDPIFLLKRVSDAATGGTQNQEKPYAHCKI